MKDDIPELPPGITCRVFLRDKIIFESQSHWLRPLFELEKFLSTHPEYDNARERLFLADRIIGRAAALMIVRLGIKRCSAPRMSRRALPVFDGRNVEYAYGTLLPRLECMTEDILSRERDPEKAWAILEERARKAAEAKR